MNNIDNNLTESSDHIRFFEANKAFATSISIKNTEPQTLYLLNLRYNINFFQIIPRKFRITAGDKFYYFNVDVLKDTSKIIEDYQYQNTDSFELYSSRYNYDVLSKFEQLYQGNAICINKNEVRHFNILKNLLKIDCLPSLSYSNFINDQKVYIQMDKNSFINYLKKSAPRSFTITTKKNEYKCNIFGILSSDVLRAYLNNYPDDDSFYFDFDDENNEFSLICSFFNFEKVTITADNMKSLKSIAKELHIRCILSDIDDYSNQINKMSLILDEYQDPAESIDELFECLYNIEKETVPFFENKNFTTWFKSEDKVQELAAFILQVIQTNFRVHQKFADLLVSINHKSNKERHLNDLVPFIVDKLMANFGNEMHECAFICLLRKKGIISDNNIMNKLKEWKATCDINYFNIINWFMPEISQIIEIESCMFEFNSIQQEWIKSYYPLNLDNYRKMRDSGEPDDALTNALRNDDISHFQDLVTFHNIDVSKGIIPYNIYEDFIDNGKTNYINYAAAYGSVRCFKFLFLQNRKVSEITFSYAIYGGNTEIIRIVLQNMPKCLKSVDKKTFISTIQKHQNQLFDWIFENVNLQIDEPDFFIELLICSTENGNIYSLFGLIDKRDPFDLINEQKTGYFNYLSRNMFKNAIEPSAKRGFSTITQILYDIIRQQKELYIIRNISAFTDFGNLQILKTVSMSIQIQNRYNGQKENNEWFINSVKNNNWNIINYYFKEKDNKLGSIHELTIYQCLKYCNTENHTGIFKMLITQLLRQNPKWVNKIFSDILPEECKTGNYYIVSNILKLTSNKNDYELYDATSSFLNASLNGSLEICNLLLNAKNLIIDFDEFINYIDELANIQINVFALIYMKSSKTMKQNYLEQLFYPAIKRKNVKLVEFLLKLNAPFDFALFYSVNSGCLEMVNLILDHCSSSYFINKLSNNGTALCIAVKNHDTNILYRLLAVPKIDPSLTDENGNTPLLIAIKNKDIDAARAIIDMNADKISQKEIDKCIKQIFEYCKNSNDVIVLSMVDFLIKQFVSVQNFDPNVVYNNNNSIMLYAIDNNDTNLVSNLLQLENIDPNVCVNEKSNTPLMISIKKLNTEIAELLIKHPKTQINHRNYHKKTALVKAAKRSLYNVIDMIISRKDFKQKESNVNLAFLVSDTESMKRLIKLRNLNVNGLIDNKTTKLIEATNNRDMEMIDLIIHHSSFSKSKSKLKKALRVALKNGYNEIITKFIPMINDVSKFTQNDNDLLSIVQDLPNSVEIVKLIINHPSFDNTKFNLDKAIGIALSKNNSSVVTLLNTEKCKIIQAQSKLNESKNKSVQSDFNASKNKQKQNDSNIRNDKSAKSNSNTNENALNQSNSAKSPNKSTKTESNSSVNKQNQNDSNIQNDKSAKSNSNANESTLNQSNSTNPKLNTSVNKQNQNNSNIRNDKSVKSNSNANESTLNQSNSTKSPNKSTKTESNASVNKQNQNNSNIRNDKSAKSNSNANENALNQSNSAKTQSKTVKVESNTSANQSDPAKNENKSAKSESNSVKSRSAQVDFNPSKNKMNQPDSNIRKVRSKKPDSDSSVNQSSTKQSMPAKAEASASLPVSKANSESVSNENHSEQAETNASESNQKKQSQDTSQIIVSKSNFNGIISYLRKKSNNAIENEIKITCSSCFNYSYFQPENVILYENQNKSYWSELAPNNWLCFEFVNNRLLPANYILRSCNLAKDCSHPKSWVIEGSNDNVSWSVLDQVEDSPHLNGPGLIHMFKIQNQPKRPFKFIRMRVIGSDWHGTESLMIGSLELFGTLFKKAK